MRWRAREERPRSSRVLRVVQRSSGSHRMSQDGPEGLRRVARVVVSVSVEHDKLQPPRPRKSPPRLVFFRQEQFALSDGFPLLNLSGSSPPGAPRSTLPPRGQLDPRSSSRSSRSPPCYPSAPDSSSCPPRVTRQIHWTTYRRCTARVACPVAPARAARTGPPSRPRPSRPRARARTMLRAAVLWKSGVEVDCWGERTIGSVRARATLGVA